MRTTTIRTILCAAGVAAVGLGGCLETDRPLTYDKGVYAGAPDEPLTADQVRSLRERANLQK